MALKGHIPWNKGKIGMQTAWNKGIKSASPAWNKGLVLGKNPDHSNRMKGCIPWNKNKKCPQTAGKNNGNWKHGEYRDKKYIQMLRHRRRHSGKYLTLKIIQMVYEENIKIYGILTCYLCLNHIEFGNDELEHKIPLSRGGDNSYINLDVSCIHCNRKKHNKTVEEYRGII